MTLNAGTRLGPYEVVSLLGKGGMGSNICISPDGETYATSFSQMLAELYAVRGLG